MAIVMTGNIPGATKDMYDSINREMGTEENVPEGLISHYAAHTGDGMLIFDVWESKDDFDRFAETRLMPAMQKVGVPQTAGMEPTVAELHNEIHR